MTTQTTQETQVASLRELYHNELLKRKLSENEAQLYGLKACTGPEIQTLIGGPCLDGIVLPYFTLEGQARTDFVRVRYFKPFAKMKYSQRAGSGTHIYFPPGFNWSSIAKNPTVKLLITEGEFKAMALAQAIIQEELQHQYAVCAVAGVNCCLKKGTPLLHPDFASFIWNDRLTARQVTIIFDYDGQNTDGKGEGQPRAEVAHAEAQLTVVLKTLKAEVALARVGKYASNPSEKFAIDDYLHQGLSLKDLLLDAEIPDYNHLSPQHRLYEFASKYAIMGSKFLEIETGNLYSEHEMRVKTGDYTYEHMGPRGGKERKYLFQDYMFWRKRIELKGFCVNYAEQDRRITSDNHYNQAHPFAFTPIPGSAQPWLDVLNAFFASDSEGLLNRFHQWVSHMIQRPWIKQPTYWQFLSPVEGIAKSFIGEHLVRMLKGPLAVSDTSGIAGILGPDDMFARFNWFLMGKLLLVANEPSSDFENHAKQLKHLITTPTKFIERKGIDQVEVVDCCHWIVSSNQSYVTQMSEHSRREYIYSPIFTESEKAHLKSLIQICDQWSTSQNGYAHMMHFYLNYDLSGYDPYQDATMSSDKENSIDLSRPPAVAFAFYVRDYMFSHLPASGVAAIPTQKLPYLFGLKQGLHRQTSLQQMRRVLAAIENTFLTIYQGKEFWVLTPEGAMSPQMWHKKGAEYTREIVAQSAVSYGTLCTEISENYHQQLGDMLTHLVHNSTQITPVKPA